MGDVKVPSWLKSLPLAPEYRPTDTEFADPIAFISRIEQEAAAFGICKVIPPLPKPSKRFVLANLTRSLSKSPELGPDAKDVGSSDGSSQSAAVFTTRHQELGSRKARVPVHKQVWQSGEVYTLEQFEAKSKAFARSQLGNSKDVSPLEVEALFWNAVEEKPIYVEYANDVPGSGFNAPEDLFRYCCHRRRQKRRFGRGKQSSGGGAIGVAVQKSGMPECPQKSPGSGKDMEGTAGWKLSNSPWNLQVIARSPGSLTRFMPDEVPGVTSPMVYIGMLFSWFAWHIEDHELHSLNFLHTGSPKTWYAVPGDYASTLEDVIRVQGYGAEVDRLAAFIMLGEKRTLMSPEVLVASGIPCCRLVQNPGEFVVTFPRAYHVGFSHGFNCGEAANFATSKWLKVAKDAAVRRAAMNYLPMLSHQQLLYMLAMSFISRVPRALLPGVRSSRLGDRRKEERELVVKRAFLDDMRNELKLVQFLLGKKSTLNIVLWETDMLPPPNYGDSSLHCQQPQLPSEQTKLMHIEHGNNEILCDKDSTNLKTGLFENELLKITASAEEVPLHDFTEEAKKNECHNILKINSTSSYMASSTEILDDDDGNLPCGLDGDSGTLPCVACGILGYPFMAIVQPSDRASEELLSANSKLVKQKLENLKLKKGSHSSCPKDIRKNSDSDTAANISIQVKAHGVQNEDEAEVTVDRKLYNVDSPYQIGSNSSGTISQFVHHLPGCQVVAHMDAGHDDQLVTSLEKITCESGSVTESTEAICKSVLTSEEKMINGSWKLDGVVNKVDENSEKRNALVTSSDLDQKWNVSNQLLRPRIFCLQHTLEVEKQLQCWGGAHVLIICHSDYLKMKAQAMSVGEEIGGHVLFEEIHMDTASKEELDLINISIDDEENQEHVEDWTSKLGLNLKHFVKCRKQSSCKQEEFLLTLGGLFSYPTPLSITSNLKWHSRRSRTPYKVLDQIRSQQNGAKKKGRQTAGKFLNGLFQDLQTSKTYESSPTDKSQNELHTKNGGTLGYKNGNRDNKRCLSTTTENSDKIEKLASDSTDTFEKSDTQKESHVASKMPGKLSTSYLDVEKNELLEIELNEVNDSVRANDSAKANNHQQLNSSSTPKRTPKCHNTPILGNCGSNDSKICTAQRNLLLEPESYEQLHDYGDVDEAGSGWKDRNMQVTGCTDSQSVTNIFDMQQDIQDETGGSHANVMEEQPTGTASAVVSSELQNTSAAKEDCVEGSLCEFFKLECLQSRKSDAKGLHNVKYVYHRRKKTRVEMGMTDMPSNAIKSSPSVTKSAPELKICQIPPADDECVLAGTTGGSLHSVERNNEHLNVGEGISFEKKHAKRRREVDQLSIDQCNFGGFIRSPCEGLRVRTRGRSYKVSQTREGKNAIGRVMKTRNHLIVRSGKVIGLDLHQCGLEGCRMTFKTKEELVLHKCNRCTYEGCGKRFRNHRYTMRHQRVHEDVRPLKCPWNGCTMSFKWAWARTEHLRVHTGERPYKCKVSGCGLTFRFVSDFSRHRRKTGHYKSSSRQA